MKLLKIKTFLKVSCNRATLIHKPLDQNIFALKSIVVAGERYLNQSFLMENLILGDSLCAVMSACTISRKKYVKHKKLHFSIKKRSLMYRFSIKKAYSMRRARIFD